MAIHKLFSKILLIQTYHTTCVSFSCEFSFFKFELGNKTTISCLSVQQSNYHPLGAVDDPMNCCPRPNPQHLGGDSFDCCTERYEIVVYYNWPKRPTCSYMVQYIFSEHEIR